MPAPDASGGSARPSLGVVKIALFALIPVTILALLAEVASAVTIQRYANLTDADANGDRAYRMRTGSWPWSRTASIRINSHGFADEEFPDSGAVKRCTHVMFIGDSFIFGDGVDGDSSFVSIVRREAASRPGMRCVRIFNLGERGTTIPRQARRVRQFKTRLRPDVVILGQYQNDLTDLLNREPRDRSLASLAAERMTRRAATGRGGDAAPRVTEDGANDGYSLLNPRLVRLLSYHALAALIRSGVHRDELRHWSVIADSTRQAEAARLTAQYSASYDSLAAELARDSTAFGVVVLPSKLDVLAGRYPEEAFFLGLAERNHVPALRIFPLLDEHRSPYAFLMYDGHFNTHGNRLVADAVIDWLFRRDPAPFPVLRARE